MNFKSDFVVKVCINGKEMYNVIEDVSPKEAIKKTCGMYDVKWNEVGYIVSVREITRFNHMDGVDRTNYIIGRDFN